jgi:hypothetical protein
MSSISSQALPNVVSNSRHRKSAPYLEGEERPSRVMTRGAQRAYVCGCDITDCQFSRARAPAANKRAAPPLLSSAKLTGRCITRHFSQLASHSPQRPPTRAWRGICSISSPTMTFSPSYRRELSFGTATSPSLDVAQRLGFLVTNTRAGRPSRSRATGSKSGEKCRPHHCGSHLLPRPRARRLRPHCQSTTRRSPLSRREVQCELPCEASLQSPAGIKALAVATSICERLLAAINPGPVVRGAQP